MITHISKTSVMFDEMCWSRSIGEIDSLNAKLRYTDSCLTEQERLITASILSCYRSLVWKTQKQRNEICKVLQQIENNEISEEIKEKC